MFACQAALQSFAVFMPSLIAYTGETTARIALMSTFACAIAFAINLFMGTIIRKLGAKLTLIIGCICCAGHFAVHSMAETIYMFWLGACVGGVAIGMATIAPNSIIISNWFAKNTGFIWGVVISGSMFAGAVMYPVVGLLIESHGWRQTYSIFAVVIAIISLFGAIFLVTESPEKLGQKPYGAGEEYYAEKYRAAADSHANVSEDVAKIKRSGSFYVMLLAIMLIGLSTNAENFLPAFWQHNGMSIAQASNYMAIYAAMCAVASIIFGRVADKVNARVFAALTSALFIFSLATMAYTQTTAPVAILLLSLVFAFGAKKMSGMLPPLVLPYSYARRNYAKLAGYGAAMLQLGIALSSPIIGALRDHTGSYQAPFYFLVALAIVAMVLMQVGISSSPIKNRQ
jgi:MFS family permease